MFLFLRLAHSHCGGKASFKYRDKAEKWKEAVRKLTICRTKGIKITGKGKFKQTKYMGNRKDKAGRSEVTHFLQNLEEKSVFLCKYLSDRLAK